jgi:hypothetical protein
MKLAIVTLLILGCAIGFLEMGQQTGLRWISVSGFAFLCCSIVALFTDISLSVIASFKPNESDFA